MESVGSDWYEVEIGEAEGTVYCLWYHCVRMQGSKVELRTGLMLPT
jgi:hypothetical protein